MEPSNAQDQVFEALVSASCREVVPTDVDASGVFLSPDLTDDGLPVFTILGFRSGDDALTMDPIDVSTTGDFHVAVLNYQVHVLQTEAWRFGLSFAGNLLKRMLVDSEAFYAALQGERRDTLAKRVLTEVPAGQPAMDVTVIIQDLSTKTFEWHHIRLPEGMDDVIEPCLAMMVKAGLGVKRFVGAVSGKHVPNASLFTLFNYVSRRMSTTPMANGAATH